MILAFYLVLFCGVCAFIAWADERMNQKPPRWVERGHQRRWHR